jgi:hypothetical protein
METIMARSSRKQPKPNVEKKRQNERQRLEKALEEGLEETFPASAMRWRSRRARSSTTAINKIGPGTS